MKNIQSTVPDVKFFAESGFELTVDIEFEEILKNKRVSRKIKKKS